MSSPNLILVPAKHPSAKPSGFEKVKVLGIDVGVLTRHRLTALVRESYDAGLKGWFSYVNVHAINISQTTPWFRLFLNDSLVTYCDGQGVRLGAALEGSSIPERIVMSDWIFDICELSVSRQAKVYLLGSAEPVMEKAVRALRILYPDLQIVGHHAGYMSDLETELVLEQINRLEPDFLIVGMGMPLQEQWILMHRDRLPACLIFNAGSCFEYVAGVKKRCPTWMGSMGLEWLYRLVQEPRRLWRRYLIGNPLFVARILVERFRPKRSNSLK